MKLQRSFKSINKHFLPQFVSTVLKNNQGYDIHYLRLVSSLANYQKKATKPLQASE